MPDLNRWETSVTEISNSAIAYRGRPVDDVIERADVAEALWLVLFGGASTPGGVDAVRRAFIAALDHGVAAPSTLVARATASTRGPLPLAIAAGLVAFAGPAHGGAAEGAAELFTRIVRKGGGTDAVGEEVSAMIDAGERIPGYGHPYHDRDPRVPALMAGVEPRREHREVAVRVETFLLQRTGKPLHMNADAAVGALVLDAGLQPPDVTLITALGRAVGLAAHAREERFGERPFRAPALASITFHPPGGAAEEGADT